MDGRRSAETGRVGALQMLMPVDATERKQMKEAATRSLPVVAVR